MLQPSRGAAITRVQFSETRSRLPVCWSDQAMSISLRKNTGTSRKSAPSIHLRKSLL